MKRITCCLSAVLTFLLFLTGPVTQSFAADPIILGVPHLSRVFRGKGRACLCKHGRG